MTWVDRFLEKMANATFCTDFVDTVQGEDGVLHANPHVIRTENGSITGILIRCRGFDRRFSSRDAKCDVTLLYDLTAFSGEELIDATRTAIHTAYAIARTHVLAVLRDDRPKTGAPIHERNRKEEG